jgi:hypothetical protein
MKKVLIETRMNSLKLNESKEPKKGCLGRLEGICADFKNPTRNGRLYPLELWKKVFNNDLFKEALESKTLFGELDHPEDRFEPLMKHACVVMTDYRIDEDAGVIYGGFDILDTPEGRTLKSIVDYGSVVGVSSRGQGDVRESVDGEIVDEDSYDFACFDVVSTPAVAKARQTVAESINRQNFKESVSRQIQGAESIADLNIIRSVVRASDLKDSDMDPIIESIEDKCKSLQEAEETILAEKEDDNTNLTEDMDQKPAKTIRDNKDLYRCIKGLREQVSAYRHRESRYVDVIRDKQNKIDSLSESVNSMRKELKNRQSLQESARRRHATKLENVVNEYDERIAGLNESLQEASKDAKRFRLENDKTLRKLNSLRSRYEEESQESSRTIQELQELLENKTSEVERLEEQARILSQEHRTEIRNIDGEVDEYSTLLEEAQQKIESGNQTISDLKETLSKTQSTLKQQKQRCSEAYDTLRKYQESYTDKISKVAGIDPKSIYHSINESTTPQQIDEIVKSYRDKLDRYSKLGISDVGISEEGMVVEGTTISKNAEDIEDERRLSFLMNVANSL